MSALLTSLAVLGIVASSGGLLTPGILRADATTKSPIDVSTSNVAEDLAVLYHDQFPTNTLSYLVPHKAAGDKYEDFKFLTMYASKGDLYLYFYSAFPRIFDNVKFVYSTSTVVSDDKTSMVENWQDNANSYVCSVHDHWGTDKVFYKAVAKSFYTYKEGDKHRVAASSLYLTGATLTIQRTCENAEYSWQDPKDGEDQVYSYYKDNYIIIDKSKGLVQLVPTKYSSTRQTEADDAQEMQWLFFSYSNTNKGANYDLGKLTAVNLQYEYLTFDASYKVDRANWTFSHYRTIYGGLYGEPDSFLQDLGHNAREASFKKVSSDIMYSTVTPNEKHIDATTSQKTWFFFWNETHEIHYTYNTLQALDDNSVSSVSDSDFKAFLNRYKSGFKYAVNFKTDNRTVTKREDAHDNFVDWYQDTQKVTTRCHEAHAIQILKLTFNTQDGVADFNALMDPIDVDEVITTVPKDYKTVALVNNKVVQGARAWLIGIGVAAGVVLIAYIWIVLSRFKRTSRLAFGFGSGGQGNTYAPRNSSSSGHGKSHK
jgi:hypothetical protein